MHEKLQKFYHAFHSVLRTTSKTRETNFPHTYSHAIPYYPTITQLDMQKTPFHFQILALDYTDDLYLYSRAIKATNPYVLRFENKLHFMCLQFNFIKLDKLDKLNVPNKIISQLDQIFLQKNSTNTHNKVFVFTMPFLLTNNTILYEIKF